MNPPQADTSTPAASPAVAPLRSRLSPADALELYHNCSLADLGRRAHAFALALHPERWRTYVVDRNINYANYCTAQCTFCNFQATPPGQTSSRTDLPEGYVLTHAQIGRKVEELLAIGGTQILLQGGLVPLSMLPFDWYLDLMRFLKREYPTIHVHGFSPPEVHALHLGTGLSVHEVLCQLRDAGLDTIPGGGAEILVDRVRRRIAAHKTSTDEYLHVMRTAHQLGMRTSITMMFGHVETVADRIEHLQRIRELQDETGGFTAFICWTFQPGGTPLGRVTPAPPERCSTNEEAAPETGPRLRLAGAHEYLRMTAIARLFLDNIPNVQASWVTQGVKIGQLALFFGATDMGSVMMEENVVSSAGTTYALTEQGIRSAIAEAGWLPRRRNCYYDLLEPAQ